MKYGYINLENKRGCVFFILVKTCDQDFEHLWSFIWGILCCKINEKTSS